LTAPDVPLRVAEGVEFERVVAGVETVPGEVGVRLGTREAVGVVVAEERRSVRGDAVAIAAEQFGDAGVVVFAGEVPQRDVDWTESEVVGVSERLPEVLPDTLPLQGVTADEVAPRHHLYLGLHRRREQERAVVPFEASVGANRQDEPGHLDRLAGFVVEVFTA
jgi:hypothetical protein